MEQKSTKNAEEMTRVQSELTKQVLASIQGMQVIKSYNLAGKNNEQLSKSIKGASEIFLELEKSVTPYIIIQRIIMGLTTVVMTYVSIKLNLAGVLGLAETILMIMASFIIFEGLIGAGSSMVILRTAENAIGVTVGYLVATEKRGLLSD